MSYTLTTSDTGAIPGPVTTVRLEQAHRIAHVQPQIAIAPQSSVAVNAGGTFDGRG